MRILLLSLILGFLANAQSFVGSKTGSLSGDSASISGPDVAPVVIATLLTGNKVASQIEGGQAVSYDGKEIHGDIVVNRADINQPITITNCDIKGSLTFTNINRVNNVINLTGTKIRGNLELNGAKFQKAFNLNRIFVQENLNLAGSSWEGPFSITQVQVNGDIDLSHVTVKGNFKVENGVFQNGLFSIAGGSFGGPVIKKSTFRNFDANESTIDGIFHLFSSTFHGHFSLNDAHLKDRVSFNGSKIFGTFSLERSTIKQGYTMNFIENMEFRGPVRVINTLFEDKVVSKNNNFINAATFMGTTFNKGISFAITYFSGPVDFTGTAFHGASSFAGVQFRGNTDFSWATFYDLADFNNAHFKQTAFFSATTFHALAKFFSTTYESGAYFDYVAFNQNVIFHESIAEGDMYFRNAYFGGTSTFAKARWFGREFTYGGHPVDSAIVINFSGSQFMDDSSFENFAGMGFMSFNNLYFKGTADFNDMNIYPQGNISFANMFVGKNLIFSQANIWADQDEIDFSNVRYMGPLLIDGFRCSDNKNYNPFN